MRRGRQQGVFGIPRIARRCPLRVAEVVARRLSLVVRSDDDFFNVVD